MLRKLALSLAVAGAISATQAHALGLGEIRVNSALNEPLDAEIRLLQVRDLSPLQIQPRMADIDEFSLAGISKSRFLTDVKFDVQVQPDGTGTIQLRSSTPIKEPFLNFLVEVNWPSGRLVREYTLLLDPPMFDPSPVPSRIQTAQSTSASESAPSPQPAEQARFDTGARPENVSNIRTRVEPGSEVYVDVDDTLYELAVANRPNRSVTPEQMMLALVRTNPGSFPTANINVMRAGTVMRLPSLEEINRLTPAQARQEAARQTRAWREGRTTPSQAPAADTAAAPDGGEAGGDAATPETTEPDSQLKVVTADAEAAGDNAPQEDGEQQAQPADGAEAGTQADAEAPADSAEGAQMASEEDRAALAARNEELENRLLLTQESVAKIEQENTELNGKIDSISSQLDKLQRLIELKDQELAMMQQRLNQESEPEKGSLLEGLMRSPGYLYGAGGAVLGLLVGLLFALRRRKKGDDAPVAEAAPAPKESKDSDAIPDVAVAAAATAAAGVAAAEAEQEKDAEEIEQPAPVPEAEAQVADDLADDELDDLDLDMDMDLDLDESAATGEPGPEEVDDSLAEDEDIPRIEDDEFDLGVDDDLTSGHMPLSQMAANRAGATAEPALDEQPGEEDLDSGLDDILGEETGQDSEDVDSGLDDLLAETDSADETGEQETAEGDDLEFAVDSFGEEDDAEEDRLDLPDDLEFAVNKPEAETPAQDIADQSDESEDDELAGLDFAVDEPKEEIKQVQEAEDDGMLDDFFAEEAVDTEDEFAPLDEVSDEEVEPLTEESVEVDTDDKYTGLDQVSTSEDDSFEMDDDLEAMLQSAPDEDEEEPEEAAQQSEEVGDQDDLDALLASFQPDDDEAPVERKPSPGERVEEELTANIAHDLESDLDSEIDDLLGSTDDDIALEEESAEESSDKEDDPMDALNLLEGADEIETKLDLARAYIEMDDTDGAKDILNEIMEEGNHFQRREAQRLLEDMN
ncbi:MAG: hypothetical protein CMI01_07725 [Oceanospirillaceae bacterium]|nr:hypothetical protein [Oceanospirillaceae bacterium]